MPYIFNSSTSLDRRYKMENNTIDEDNVPSIIYDISWPYLAIVGTAGITLNLVALTIAAKVIIEKRIYMIENINHTITLISSPLLSVYFTRFF